MKQLAMSPTQASRIFGMLSGDGSLSINRTFVKLTNLDEIPIEAVGLTVSTPNHNITILQDGAYQIQFFASVESTLTIDTPDTCHPKAMLFVNDLYFDATVGAEVRLRSGINRSMAFSCIADLVANDVLDIRCAIVGNESQQITIMGSPIGGTFTLTFDGQTTTAIARNASAATVQVALEALGNIGSGNVSCTGGPLPNIQVNVEFIENLAESDVVAITGNGAGLTGPGAPYTVTITIPSPSSDTITFDQCTWTIAKVS